MIAECLRPGGRYYDFPPLIRPQRKSETYLGGQHSATVQNGDQRIEVEADLSLSREASRRQSSATIEFNPFFQDTYGLSTDIQIFFQDVQPDFLETELVGDPWHQKKKDLDALRDILGITYDEVIYYPVDVSGAGWPFPYVRARKGEKWIDSFQMSYGELSVHILRSNIRDCPENSLLLLDEPEAYIAPRGRAALLDEMATLARSFNRQIVITTHSAEFMQRIPLSCIRMCVRLGESRAILKPSRPADLRDTLGVDHPLRFFVVVEDEVAASALTLILTAHQFPFISETEILQAGSWKDVTVTLKSLSSSNRVRAVAVVDGDQKGALKSSSDLHGVLFLPGFEPSEKVFVQYAARHPEELARRLGCPIQSISVYIAEMLGVDHHRWLTLLSKRTGHDWRYCLRAAFEIWHADSENEAEANSLVEHIVTALQLGAGSEHGG
ncbi:AAA family ATPase [Streptomyces sp. NPDC001792]|uniref:AAA family ATPase n=1 Tax=Streptomyces sp. NPDC001792 TaxID=3154524 RepID=UPI00332C6691